MPKPSEIFDTPEATGFSRVGGNEERVKRQISITRYLRDTYGLEDDSTLNAGEVEELCEMIVEHFITTKDQENAREIELIKKEYGG